MTHRTERRASRPVRSTEKWDKHRFEMKLVNPANKRKYTVIVVGSGLAGGVGRGHARRARLQRHVLLLPGLAAPRALASPRRAASTPRRTTRTTATASTGCSTTRSRAATSARARPTSTGSRRSASTSSTSASRRACRSRASTAGCSRTARSAARRSRARSTRAARPASSCCSARTRRWSRRSRTGGVTMYPAHRDARPRRGRRAGARHRHARPGHRRDRAAPRRRRRARDRRLRQRLLPLDEREGLQRHRDLARVQARRGVREPVLHADPPDVHPGQRRLPVEAHADVASRCATTAASGCRSGRRTVGKTPDRDPGSRSATTTSSASTRASATSSPRDIASRAAKEVCDEGRGVGPGGRGVYLDFADAIKRLGEDRIARALRQPVRDVRAHHRRESVRGADAHLSRPCTTRWAGSGWTTTS